MEKIEIKLKECCLTCEHFDPSGIKGFGAYIACCGEPKRIIACGHIAVCKTYLESKQKNKPQLMEWVSIKDRLPNEEELCLITNERGDIEATLFSKGKFFLTDQNGYQTEMPYCTHWIPIPETPK